MQKSRIDFLTPCKTRLRMRTVALDEGTYRCERYLEGEITDDHWRESSKMRVCGSRAVSACRQSSAEAEIGPAVLSA
jgi:hypothetical protein